MTVSAVGYEHPTAHQTLTRFRDAARALDTDGMLACYADDAQVWTPEGYFAGKPAIRRYLYWLLGRASEFNYAEHGLGEVVVGSTATVEYVQTGVAGGFRYEVPMVEVLEFDDSGAIRRQRSYYDRWTVLRQVGGQTSGIRGTLFRWFSAAVDRRITRGLSSRSV
jgi:ketosteroid isomerase-like protein